MREMTDALTWQTRRLGRLVLRFQPHSFAARDADELVHLFDEALLTVTNALGLPAEQTPIVTVQLVDQAGDLPSEAATGPGPGEVQVGLVYNSETGSPCPEVELTRALAGGQPQAAERTRFWIEGLAGYLAARSGRAPYYAEAVQRCRRLLADGLLPPLEELQVEARWRLTPVASLAATAFATYLIECHSLARYRHLLQSVETHTRVPFQRVYRTSLAVADRDWRRDLESESPGGLPALGTARRLLPLARAYWSEGLRVLLYLLVGIGFSLALPLSFRFLVDNVLGQRPLGDPIPFIGPTGHVISDGQEQLEVLTKLGLALGLLYLVAALARTRLTALANSVGESFVLDLRQRMIGVLAHLPASYYARTSTADLSQRVLQDTTIVQQALTGAIVPSVGAILALVLYALLLVALQVRLTLIALIALPLLALVYGLRRRARQAAARERVRRVSDLTARVNELATAQAAVKLYGAAPQLTRTLSRRLGLHRQLNLIFARESSLLGQTAALIMNLTQVAVLLYGGYLVVASNGAELAPGGLVAFYVLLNQLFAPVAQLTSASQNLAGAAAAVERVDELLAAEPEPDDPLGVELARLRTELRLENVSFSYRPGGRAVLRNLSLTIPAGATVGFVGPTGAGKSSIVYLLTRLFEIDRGQIQWDGIDLRRARLASLRRQVVLVPQESVVLSASVYDNICFGLREVKESDVRHAAQQAAAAEFIENLPEGYDTLLGERGLGLSGGQRQRVALARALLRRPSVLILDEATSALDATTQRSIHDRLRADQADRTIVKIAHRLETVSDADKIFVLDDGQLVEQGGHASLLAAGGLYARLFEDQVGLLHLSGEPSARDAARWLARLAPFAGLSQPQLDRLTQRLRPIRRPAGTLLYRQGGESDQLYVLGRGSVEVVAEDESGAERIVTVLDPGTPFGVGGLVRGTPRSATVRTATDVLLYALDQANFQALRADPALGPR